jgi:hypothetical protein
MNGFAIHLYIQKLSVDCFYAVAELSHMVEPEQVEVLTYANFQFAF